MVNKEIQKRSNTLPIYISALIVLMWFIWTPALWALFSSPEKIGDSYGGFTSLVTGLSLVAIWLNLRYQRLDTATQVKMLSQQLDEAKESKDALSLQVLETERLSKITALHSKLTFFSQQSIVGSRLMLDEISAEMYEHDVKTEIKRLLSSMDQLTGHRGKRIIDVDMEKYHVCKVWSMGIPYPAIKVTLLGITDSFVSLRLELPAGYQHQLLRVTETHPGNLFSHASSLIKRKVGQELTLTGEDQLHFNVSMNWGCYPNSKNDDVTFNSAPHVNRRYISNS